MSCWSRVQELARSKTSGFVLILSGLAIAAHATLSDLGSGWAPSAVPVTGAVPVNAPFSGPLGEARPSATSAIAPRMSRGGSRAVAPSAPVVVTLAPRSGDAAASRTAGIPKDRGSLVRELQKGLRRVGCYAGELNGAWTPATRRAMKTFTERVNATLPVDEPDAVLFAMVQSQQERVCGKPCPVDQGLSEDGRCLPNAILAKARKPSPSAVATYVPASGAPAAGKSFPARGWSATVTAARPTLPQAGPIAPAPATPPPTEGRMALAGPIEGHAAGDPRLGINPTAPPGNVSRTKLPQPGSHFVSTPRRRTFVNSVFRRIESRL
jgi:hypothetical protein